ncbi:MAG: hypothetical protein U1D41_06910 [Nitrosomonas sp.]|uniref:hypothetical protein n=1 Tax=Nitrosomonas sp. TaxID=42353 RepID=UPI002737487F|nr:hypothetical protein [Nitrosomonas sp.]MDP3662323.1 hypothetical protein [Nitrosomonas sp.]MDZ4105878.1 hypothetical protein [Nitrosomonas sp.]
METRISALSCDISHLHWLIKLGRTYYPEDNPALSEHFLKWLYIDNNEGPATLIVAEEDDLWIGMMVLIPVTLERKGELQKACFAVNLLAHPEHRTKNLFVKIIKCAREHLSSQNIWLLAHPNANSAPGWKRQKMMFRDPLHLHLAKFKLPFSGKQVRRINTLADLKALPEDFWHKLSKNPDVHLKYTPEFIAWRFLDVPYKNYVISAVESGNELLGLRVTRHFKWSVDLMVDFIAPNAHLCAVLASVYKPTLLIHSGLGGVANQINAGAWKLPYKRVFPFFITTWEPQMGDDDMNGITLGASDF